MRLKEITFRENKFRIILLNEYHHHVDDGDVVDGVGNVPRLVEERLGVPHVVAHLDAPEEEEEFA